MSYLVAAHARGSGLATTALTEPWTHRDDLGSRKVAERAGFVRDPARDQDREIKNSIWPMVSYQLVP